MIIKSLLIFSLLFISMAQAAEPKDIQAKSTVKNVNKKTIPSSQSKPVDLKTAYKREYAFLDAQKRELTKRLSEFNQKAKISERKLQNKIRSLEHGSVNRSSEIEKMTAQFNDAEYKNTAIVEHDEVLKMTYSQAEATLKKYQKDTDNILGYAKGPDERKVALLFDQALALVRNLGEQRKSEGKFFLASGKEVQGEIIQLGNIAAFGSSNEGSGSLVPAGAGNLKLWGASTPDTAESLANKEQPEQLEFFLFESRDKAIEETPEKTWRSVVESGGVIGWIIVGLGIIGLVLIAIRVYLLITNSSDTQKLTAQVTNHLNNGEVKQAKDICQAGECAITRVLESTLRHIKDDRDHMDDIISEAILQESSVLNRFGTSILVIASVSPLLGLLGTVTGMISTFDIITEFGTGDPKLLSGGISIALVTTELGLIVAIPTLLLGSLLSAWSENIKLDMEVAALRITNNLLGTHELNQTVDKLRGSYDNDPLLVAAQTA